VRLRTVDRLEQGLLDPEELLTPLSEALAQPKRWLLDGAGREEDLAILELRLNDVDRAWRSWHESARSSVAAPQRWTSESLHS
jgi:hypothetical protein